MKKWKFYTHTVSKGCIKYIDYKFVKKIISKSLFFVKKFWKKNSFGLGISVKNIDLQVDIISGGQGSKGLSFFLLLSNTVIYFKC